MTKARKILFGVALIIVLYFILSYLGRITGTVVDAETNQPIEGAAILVEWSISVSVGYSATDSYKVVETVTGKDGKFSVLTVLNPFVDPPILTIYKKGYVAWNSERIFPEGNKRQDFEQGKDVVAKLEIFKESYSHDRHVMFIDSCIRSSQAFEEKRKMYQALDWELSMARAERQRNNTPIVNSERVRPSRRPIQPPPIHNSGSANKTGIVAP